MVLPSPCGDKLFWHFEKEGCWPQLPSPCGDKLFLVDVKITGYRPLAGISCFRDRVLVIVFPSPCGDKLFLL